MTVPTTMIHQTNPNVGSDGRIVETGTGNNATSGTGNGNRNNVVGVMTPNGKNINDVSHSENGRNNNIIHNPYASSSQVQTQATTTTSTTMTMVAAGSRNQQQHQQYEYQNTPNRSLSQSVRGSNHQLACLYTKHKTQKHKKWIDGRLVIVGTRAVLHHAHPPPGSSDPSLDECEISVSQLQNIVQNPSAGHSLETDRFLIDVEGPWTAAAATVGGGGTISSSSSRSTGMQKLLTKRGFKKPQAYVPPPPHARIDRVQNVLGKRRRPLQPGELVAMHYGGGSGSTGQGQGQQMGYGDHRFGTGHCHDQQQPYQQGPLPPYQNVNGRHQQNIHQYREFGPATHSQQQQQQQYPPCTDNGRSGEHSVQPNNKEVRRDQIGRHDFEQGQQHQPQSQAFTTTINMPSNVIGVAASNQHESMQPYQSQLQQRNKFQQQQQGNQVGNRNYDNLFVQNDDNAGDFLGLDEDDEDREESEDHQMARNKQISTTTDHHCRRASSSNQSAPAAAAAAETTTPPSTTLEYPSSHVRNGPSNVANQTQTLPVQFQSRNTNSLADDDSSCSSSDDENEGGSEPKPFRAPPARGNERSEPTTTAITGDQLLALFGASPKSSSATPNVDVSLKEQRKQTTNEGKENNINHSTDDNNTFCESQLVRNPDINPPPQHNDGFCMVMPPAESSSSEDSSDDEEDDD